MWICICPFLKHPTTRKFGFDVTAHDRSAFPFYTHDEVTQLLTSGFCKFS